MTNEEAIEVLKTGLDYPMLHGAYAKAIDALQMQIPKNPSEDEWDLVCPDCNVTVGDIEKGMYVNYCPRCGRRLYWKYEPYKEGGAAHE